MKHLQVFLILMILAAPAWAAKLAPPQVLYTAQSNLEMDHGTIQSTVYYRPDMLRREEKIGETLRIFILREDLKQAWVLLPEEKTYLELNWHQAKRVKNDLLDYLRDKSLIGEEEIKGIKTKKYEIVAIQPDGTKFDGFMWISKEGIPIKVEATEMGTGFAIPYKREITNIKITKKLKPDLFEVPSDFTPIVQERQKRLLVREIIKRMTMR